MNITHKARAVYGQPESSLRSSRQIEYDLFARLTRRLAEANLQRNTDFPTFARALHDNLRLWSILAMDVATPGNALPPALRAKIFYLYEFTSRHTRQALSDGADASVLTDINQAIMRGLRGEGEPR